MLPAYDRKRALLIMAVLQETLLSGFDFLVAPLVHPRYDGLQSSVIHACA